MRCLHCGKRLSLLRKFSDAEFCSDEHRQEFQQQQSDLALARLIEAQNRMERPKPPKPPIAAKPSKKTKKVVEQEPGIPMARMVYEYLPPVAVTAIQVPPLATQIASAPADLPSPELSLSRKGFGTPGQLALGAPLPAAPAAVRTTPGRALFRLSVSLPSHPAAMAAPQMRTASGLLALHDTLAAAEQVLRIQANPTAAGLSHPALPAVRFTPDRIEAPPPPPQPKPEPEPAFGIRVGIRLEPAALPPARLHARASWLLSEPAPASLALPPEPVRLQSPGMAALDGPPALRVLRQGTPAATVACATPAPHLPASPVLPPEPVRLQSPGMAALDGPPALTVLLRRTPAATTEAAAPAPQLPAFPPAAPPLAALRPIQRQARIKVKAMAAAAGVCAPAAQPALTVPPASFPALALVSTLPGLRSSGQQPLALDIQASAAAACPALPWLSGLLEAARGAAYPRSTFHPLPPEPAAPVEVAEPEPTDQVPPPYPGLPVILPRPADCGRGTPRWAGPVMAVAAPPDPRMPACRFTIDHADGSGPRHSRPAEAPRKKGLNFAFDARRLPGRKFWMHAPADLKWVALGLPLLLVLVLYSFRPGTPKPDVAEEQVASTGRTTALGGQLNAVQRVILSRAAVKLFDDFRGGLGSWNGEDGWSKSWKYGDASFLEPGQLALYAPSVGMRDYTFQFLGQIERKSLNWVFRASDSKNYYSMRIVITRGGPLPEAQLVRSTVIAGKERDVKAMPIPFTVQADTLYLVKMDIRGADYTTYIQGQVVDTFTDSRLEQGGVGFYSAKGEQSMLRWVEVTHQYDFVGRLCALMAPYDMAAQGRQAN